jgi:ABC-2 type transport system permease protein
MNAFIAVVKNDIARLVEQKSRLWVFLGLTAGAIAVAIALNASTITAPNVAFVNGSIETSLSDQLNVTVLDDEPPLSELVAGTYDAVVIFEADGSYRIESIRSAEFVSAIEAAISGSPNVASEVTGQRGVAANIIGFMTMFLLMQGSSVMFVFAEDKEKKHLKRIAASPISFSAYMFAHSLFVFTILFVPTIAMLAFTHGVLGVDIGLGMGAYLVIVALLSALATAFALFMFALIDGSDSAAMLASTAIILTTILAGSLYSFERGNRILEAVITVLPQRNLLQLTDVLERGGALSAALPYGAAIVATIAILFGIALIKTRTEYRGA